MNPITHRWLGRLVRLITFPLWLLALPLAIPAVWPLYRLEYPDSGTLTRFRLCLRDWWACHWRDAPPMFMRDGPHDRF